MCRKIIFVQDKYRSLTQASVCMYVCMYMQDKYDPDTFCSGGHSSFTQNLIFGSKDNFLQELSSLRAGVSGQEADHPGRGRQISKWHLTWIPRVSIEYDMTLGVQVSSHLGP